MLQSFLCLPVLVPVLAADLQLPFRVIVAEGPKLSLKLLEILSSIMFHNVPYWIDRNKEGSSSIS